MRNSEPGVYRSDVEGHLLILQTNPVSVTCVICMETCASRGHKNHKAFREAVATFVSKHGALDERIASTLAEMIPPRSILAEK